jgi:hypothetical protein
MTKRPRGGQKRAARFKKLTAEQRKEVYRQPDDWTKQTGSDTYLRGGQVPKRSTDEDPRGGHD